MHHVGSRFCGATFASQEQADAYRFNHEQYALDYLKSLVPASMGLRCRLGFHDMQTKSVTDGGGITIAWGRCLRCNRAYWRVKHDESNRWSTF